jgi:ankyrin repeat protein
VNSRPKAHGPRPKGCHRKQAFGLRRPLALGLWALGLSALLVAAEDTRVLDAVRAGDAVAVRSLLARKAPVNAASPDGTTALHYAAEADRADLVSLLLSAGADARAVNRYGVAPLMLAATNGNAVVIERLLGAGASPNSATPDGETVLMTASRTGKPAAVRALLAAGADVNAREKWQGETAVMWAAAHDHAEAVRLLAARGADLNVTSIVPQFPKARVDLATMVTTALPKGGLTAALFAARQGALNGTRALAEAGANLDATDPDGTTALNIAIINTHYEVAMLLVEKGANPNIGDAAGMTPLYAAVDMRHQEPLINRPLRKPVGLATPLDVIRTLLAARADPNLALKSPLLMRQHNTGDASLGEGATPLMRAAKVSDAELIRLLLAGGADPNRTLRNRTTALMIAVQRASRAAGPESQTVEAVRALVAGGADVNAASEGGETALHMAVSRGDGLVRALVESGARLDARDASGRTPLDVAMGVAPAPSAGRGRGGRGGPAAPPQPRPETARLLRELAGL